MAVGHTLLACESILKGLSRLEHDPGRIGADLDYSWEVLAEAVQTIMRRYGTADAYEQLKELTRGEAVDQAGLQAFIKGLDLPADARDALLELTPRSYTGLATRLAADLEKHLKKVRQKA